MLSASEEMMRYLIPKHALVAGILTTVILMTTSAGAFCKSQSVIPDCCQGKSTDMTT